MRDWKSTASCCKPDAAVERATAPLRTTSPATPFLMQRITPSTLCLGMGESTILSERLQSRLAEDLSEANFCDAASGFLQIGIDVLEKASDKCRQFGSKPPNFICETSGCTGCSNLLQVNHREVGHSPVPLISQFPSLLGSWQLALCTCRSSWA